jgi:hypothetical protein
MPVTYFKLKFPNYKAATAAANYKAATAAAVQHVAMQTVSGQRATSLATAATPSTW